VLDASFAYNNKNITYIAVTLEKPGIKRRRGKASWALVIDDLEEENTNKNRFHHSDLGPFQ
jgi:hypothetical protein